MALRFGIFALSILGLAAEPNEQCIAGEACVHLLQTTAHVKNLVQDQSGAAAEELSEADAAGPLPQTRVALKPELPEVHWPQPALFYFRHWSQGKVGNALGRKYAPGYEGPAEAETPEAHTPGHLSRLLRQHQDRECGPKKVPRRPLDSWKILDTARDAKGVRHTLLRAPGGRLQYLAARGEGLLAADPPACPRARRLGLTQGGTTNTTADWPAPPAMAGEEEGLSPQDPLVNDSVSLIVAVAQGRCNKEYSIQVLSAVVNVIDGLDVHLQVRITGSSGSQIHQVQCAFELSEDKSDADALLEVRGGPNGSLPSSLQGPLAEVIMDGVDLCEADSVASLSPAELEAAALAMRRPRGELSRYKGYAHVNDGLPKLAGISLLRTQAPADYDLQDIFPDCFPDNGEEVMRNQGTCGSCWAFASASATMANLCTSAEKAGLRRRRANVWSDYPDDRYEISVQQMMSCNDAAGGCGCDGGFAAAAADAFKDGGITKDVKAPYECSGGDPLDHFEASSQCSPWVPSAWTSSCDTGLANSNWNWFGAAELNDAEDMKTVIAAGEALYATLDVYDNFMNWGGGGVLTSTSGSYRGGHAVAMLGYGVKGGVDYWRIQNSWGTSWADGGYAKLKRGINLAGIEDAAYYMRAYVDGGAEPPCFDGANSGFVGPSGLIPCSDALNGPYGNLCTAGADVSCAVTCGLCDEVEPVPFTTTPAPDDRRRSKGRRRR